MRRLSALVVVLALAAPASAEALSLDPPELASFFAPGAESGAAGERSEGEPSRVSRRRLANAIRRGKAVRIGGSRLSRRLLVNGDSLAVGTQPYLPRELGRWKVTQSTAVSRHAFEGASVLRAYGRGLPRVIHVSLGTNDDPRSVSAFRSAIREVMAVAGARRCVVWANVVRPPVAGASYAGYNRALAQESRPRKNLRVVNWARMVRENSYWLAGDGVHVSAQGYQVRARAVARSVRRCR